MRPYHSFSGVAADYFLVSQLQASSQLNGGPSVVVASETNFENSICIYKAVSGKLASTLSPIDSSRTFALN